MRNYLLTAVFILIIGFGVVFWVLADTPTLRPIADGGDDSASWTNTTGTACNSADCYLEVDESSGASCTDSDGDSSYIEASINGASQTFDIDLSAIPGGSIINKIDITICQKRIGSAPPNQFQIKYCSNGVCVDSGSDIGAAGNYAQSTHSFSTSINKYELSDIEIGVVITGTQNKVVRVSQLGATITFTGPDKPGPSGGASVRRVVLSGQAYAPSSIELLRRSSEDEEFQQVTNQSLSLSNDGMFSISYLGLSNADYFFALRVKDQDGRDAGVLSFNTQLVDNFTVNDIFVPPTVDFENALLKRGRDIKLFGYASPYNPVEVEIDGETAGETKADNRGYYTLAVNTDLLQNGLHQVRVRQIDNSYPRRFIPPRDKSVFSASRTFKVTALLFPEADLNSDDKINITDWSIFLVRSRSGDTKTLETIDLDRNGEFNIFDFSIFLQAIKT